MGERGRRAGGKKLGLRVGKAERRSWARKPKALRPEGEHGNGDSQVRERRGQRKGERGLRVAEELKRSQRPFGLRERTATVADSWGRVEELRDVGEEEESAGRRTCV